MDKQTESLARQEFEKWLRSQPHVLNVGVSESGSYVLREDRIAWSAWKASRESLVVEIASHTEFEIEHMISPDKEGYSLGWIDGRNYAARQVEAIGIRIKGEGV